jgi:glycosyl transferase family 87
MLSNDTLETSFGLTATAARQWGDLIRAVTSTIACLVVAAMSVIYFQTARNTISVRHLQDYGMFDFSARQLRAGAELYAPPRSVVDPDRPRPLNLNPPHFHLLMLPLTALSPERAFAVWIVASLIALAIMLAVIGRAVDLRMWGFATLAAASVLSPALHATMLTGQLGLLLLVPFTLGWLAARGGRDASAGAWLGFCASIKPFVLLFAIAFVVQKRWRAVAAMAGVGMTMLAIGGLTIGVHEYAVWLRQLAGVSWAEHYMNASLLGLLERSFSATPWGTHPLIDLPIVIRPLWFAAATVIAMVTLTCWRQSHDVDRTFLITAAAMLLLSPLGWVYYLWFLLPPLLASLMRRDALAARGRGLVWVGLAALFVPSPAPWLSFMTGAMTATVGSIYAWGLLLLWIGVAVGPRRPSTSTGPRSPSRRVDAVGGVTTEQVTATVIERS